MDAGRRGRLRLKGDKKPRQEGREGTARETRDTQARDDTEERNNAGTAVTSDTRETPGAQEAGFKTPPEAPAGKTQSANAEPRDDHADPDDALTPAQRAHERVRRQRVPTAP